MIEDFIFNILIIISSKDSSSTTSLTVIVLYHEFVNKFSNCDVRKLGQIYRVFINAIPEAKFKKTPVDRPGFVKRRRMRAFLFFYFFFKMASKHLNSKNYL